MRSGQQYREQQRGAREHSQQLRALREKWPLAFPVREQDVRPLALNVARQIAAAMGWSAPYTHGVLRPWKQTASYCRAMLSHDQRITLDGEPAETIDADARDLAARGLLIHQLARQPDDAGEGRGSKPPQSQAEPNERVAKESALKDAG
jgi:sRNA-binding protein